MRWFLVLPKRRGRQENHLISLASLDSFPVRGSLYKEAAPRTSVRGGFACFVHLLLFSLVSTQALTAATKGTVRTMPMEPATPWTISMAIMSLLRIWREG